MSLLNGARSSSLDDDIVSQEPERKLSENVW